MTAQTYTARQTAREVSKRLGRDVSDKRVRAWVRDNVPAYDDDGYTPHLYDRRTFDRIVAAMVAKGRAGRAVAAATGRATVTRSPNVAKVAKVAKVAPSAPSATVPPETTGSASA